MTSSIADDLPPQVTSLEEIYPENVVPFQRKRYAKLKKAFVEKYGVEPQFYARSPGRVNLIGEHIDYEGYSVLPMAVDRDIVTAVAVTDTTPAHITLANIASEKFPTREFHHEAEGAVTIDSKVHEWSNYFKCGYKGIFEDLQLNEARSFVAMVDGTVPGGAGVSSSSALVCCAALATLTANDGKLTKGELVKTAIRSERYAGLESGGMDQSISIMAPKGSPLIIHFHPSLTADPVTIPPPPSPTDKPVFVVANTLVTADKHVTAPIHYNLRVIECRLASLVLCKELNLPPVETLREVQEKWMQKEGLDVLEGREIEALQAFGLEVRDSLVKEGGYTLEDV
ncbi:galactokinase, partial [Rhizophlyctis rosea]